LAAFRYRDFGALATIGRKRAVAQIGGLKLSGFIAWLLWSFAHIYFLIGFRNRLIVAMNWLWNYATFQRGTRLITGMSGSRMEDVPQPTDALAANPVTSAMHEAPSIPAGRRRQQAALTTTTAPMVRSSSKPATNG
jgi:hypothetical protein